MLLRLLLSLDVGSICIAGLDGYTFSNKENFYCDELNDKEIDYEGIQLLNREISDMLLDIIMECKESNIPICFLTRSLYEKVYMEEA